MESKCHHFVNELTLPMFSLIDSNGKMINLQKTFASASNTDGEESNRNEMISKAGLKLAFILKTAYFLYDSIEQFPDFKGKWLLFLTSWGHILSLLYFITSFLAAVDIIQIQKQISFFPKFLWVLFIITINIQVSISVLFWTFVYVPSEDKYDYTFYSVIFSHGILCLMVALDGLGVNRIPLRLKQIIWVYFIPIVYIILTIVYGLKYAKYPSDDATVIDDDGMYDLLNWKEEPLQTSLIMTGFLFALVPFQFLCLWSVSLIIPRRYIVPETAATSNSSAGEKPPGRALEIDTDSKTTDGDLCSMETGEMVGGNVDGISSIASGQL